MNQLTLHPTSAARLDSLIQHLPQALLISGPSGVGLATIARTLSSTKLAGFVAPQDSKAQIDYEKGTISAEVIRGLYEQTRAKYKTDQIIIIDDADRMSLTAQNSFLKLLEEPNAHIYFILTSHSPQLLVSTIRSRVQSLEILPITSDQSDAFLESLHIDDMTIKTKLKYIAEGFPAEMQRLLLDTSNLEAKAHIAKDAREFLLGTSYQKLLIINAYYSDREKSLTLIDSVLHLARRNLSTKPQKALIGQLEQLLRVREHILSNYNVRLQLLRLVV